ncbi:DUF1573 domain-containing protein [Cytophagaceae bacterium SJW1-29]|uniref:DUF1573 domain-containing protein n=2 Tax=Salmonirosea aquatica TaxID=2654236 RepID=A0A7C9BCR8_9BACT|nr:DUF1573 domain-containing protein [Cytophagaceae bacterium SJW1-29]
MVTLGTLLGACGEKKDKNSTAGLQEKIPVLAMQDSTTYQFGEIKEGEIVEHAFKFKNGGQFPLIINNVTASCGCTIPEWPREPIAPNEEAAIMVRFNSKGKPGPQVKTITVYANTEPAYSELRLQGIVAAAPDTLSD